MNFVDRSKKIRKLTLECIASIGVGHVGGCLSLAEVLSVLYTKYMNGDPKNPGAAGRNRLVLSKGHAGPALYATLASFGYFPETQLQTLNKLGTSLPSHCDMNLTAGVDMTAGSLGQGISAAVGMAVASKIVKDGARIYCIIGDGESQEGQVWEAVMLAAHKKLDNFTLLLDNNKMQIDGATAEILYMEDFSAKFKAFGFNVIRVDGHDCDKIDKALETAGAGRDGKPFAIILDTVKGKGVKYIEELGAANHNIPLTADDLKKALAELL